MFAGVYWINFIYFYISKNIISYILVLVFKIVESLESILKVRKGEERLHVKKTYYWNYLRKKPPVNESFEMHFQNEVKHEKIW